MSQPRLVLVAGRPGAGKTTLARALATHIPCPLISRDALKEGLLVSLDAHYDDLGAEVDRRIYDVFFAITGRLLAHGISLVIEAAFQHRLWVRGLAELPPAQIRLILCEIAPDLAQQRFIERGQAHPERARFHGPLSPASPWRPPTLDAPTLRVNTSRDDAPPLAQILAFARSSDPPEQ